jgi:hypothetical protein
MARHKSTPAELKEGLEPIKISLMLSHEEHTRAISLALRQREAELSKKLEVLRKWKGIPPGPMAYRELCIALAADLFRGFSEKKGRKPKKWTVAAQSILAGEMCREMMAGGNQEQAAKRLSKREPWRSMLASGGHRLKRATGNRETWETLLHQYQHTPQRYRTVGEHAYRLHVANGTAREWSRIVNELTEGS